MSRADWIKRHPDFTWLAVDDTRAIESVLRRLELLDRADSVTRVTKAGEGNMNLTLRVLVEAPGSARSLVVKQARPWVEKYDQIDAPWERANVEAAFYQRIQRHPRVAARMPRLIAFDEHSRTLVMEDLGNASDYFPLYRGQATLEPAVVDDLADWLRGLHDGTHGPPDPALANRAMRELNHQHIFVLPLREPTTIKQAAAKLVDDVRYRDAVHAAGERYLADGSHLVHGDFFPGSWLNTERGVFVIDPEFGFYGEREFDLGVALAHVAMAQCGCDLADRFLSRYGAETCDGDDVAVNAGIEIMRRLIGVAQLPLSNDFDREAMLWRSRDAVVERNWRLLWHE